MTSTELSLAFYYIIVMNDCPSCCHGFGSGLNSTVMGSEDWIKCGFVSS